MTTSIICPHCHTPISLDDALTAQIKSKLTDELSSGFEKKLAEERSQLQKQLTAQISEEKSKELSFLQEQLEDKKKKLDLAQEKELELRKKEISLEEREKSRELELARRLEEERKKLQEVIEGRFVEAQRQKELEKDKQINDLKRLLEDAQRKANQGSQQTQGEVRELILEQTLRDTFRDDSIEPVGKGVSGADVKQIVKTARGTVCGSILWESKQTKAWSEVWISKLKADLRSEESDIAILVTAVYQDPHWSGQVYRDGIWIVSFALFLPLAMALRKGLIDTARERASSQNRGQKADLLYAYLTSPSFRQQVESMVEVYTETQTQIAREKVAMEKIWKMREGQSARMLQSLGSIYGSIQGLAGANVVPELSGLELFPEPGQKTLLE